MSSEDVFVLCSVGGIVFIGLVCIIGFLIAVNKRPQWDNKKE
jgi:hypothetical protein